MAGHSKWAQIKHKKAITDARKGKLFSKISAQTSVAAKGGGDPAMNPTLRDMIEAARAAGMTKENVERAIKRGTGELSGAELESVRYEAYGPGGTGFVIDAITDNKNRTISEIRSTLNKFGGKLADTGSVMFQFEPKGVITLNLLQLTTVGRQVEEIELLAIDAGAEDIDEGDEVMIIYTKPTELYQIDKALKSQNIPVESSALSLEPKTTIQIIDLETAKKVIQLAQALDDFDDVANVSTNFEIDQAIVNQI
jgi:YebC/PmpR family DNA-binding regulatory protein